MRRALAWLTWFAALFALWLVFGGVVHDRYERIGGLCAAAVAATAAEVVRSQGLLHFRVERRWLRRAWRPLVRVVPEFLLVVAALSRPGRRGAFRAVEFPTGGERTADKGRRALAGAVGSLAPNLLVVEADPDERALLVHELVPGRSPEEPL